MSLPARLALVSRFAPLALLLLAAPMAAQAQQSGVEDASTINDFRLDQPAGPGNPARPQPASPTTPTPKPAAPASTAQPKPKAPPQAQPKTAAPRPTAPAPASPTATAKPVPAPTSAPEATDSSADTPPNLGTEGVKDAPAIDTEPALPAVSESLPDTPLADTAPTVEPAAEGKAEAATSTQILSYWPYAIGGLALLALAIWFVRRRKSGLAAEDDAADASVAAAPTLDLTPARAPMSQPDAPAAPPVPAERKAPPSGTVGVSAAKVFGAPPAPPAPRSAPSAAAQGFVTTRAPRADAARAAPPAGTVGIPASRIAAPEAPPPSATALVEGTRLAAQFAAPELIRDADGLRLKFALGIGNIGTMTAKEVRVRTVLLTAAPDSDRAIAEWMANPKGPAATTIDAIEGGTQTNITGDIQLGADQIRAMAMQGNVIFVPMFAISIDFLGAEGLDRFGEAYVIGLPPERKGGNGAARVLPLPHDEKLPRRWTDLVHRRADIAA